MQYIVWALMALTLILGIKLYLNMKKMSEEMRRGILEKDHSYLSAEEQVQVKKMRQQTLLFIAMSVITVILRWILL